MNIGKAKGKRNRRSSQGPRIWKRVNRQIRATLDLVTLLFIFCVPLDFLTSRVFLRPMALSKSDALQLLLVGYVPFTAILY